MGHYFGNAVRITLKKEAPEHLHQLVRKFEEKRNFIAALQELGLPELTLDIVDTESLSSVFMINGFPYDAFEYSKLEELPEGLLCEVRGSSKRHCVDEVLVMLLTFGEHLLLQEGDVVFRTIYEDSDSETILYFDGKRLVSGNGCKYHEGDYNDKHPANHQGSMYYSPPWTMAGIKSHNWRDEMSRNGPSG